MPKFPKPPVNNMTDFVVFCFISIVTFVLVSAVLGMLLSVIFNPEGDRATIIAILADITTSLISALVGFIAGKGQGHAEAAEERRVEEKERHEEVMKQQGPMP